MATAAPNQTVSIYNTSASDEDAVRGYLTEQGVLLALISGLGQSANLWTIIIYAASPKLKTPSNVFIVNLCVADSLFLACSWPAVVTLLHYDGHRFIGEVGCFIAASLMALGAITSIETIGAIAVTRYIGIVKPEWKSQLLTWRKCIVCSVCLWLYSVMLVVPTFTNWAAIDYLETHYFCTIDWGHNIWYSVILCVLSYGISNVAIIFSYVWIYSQFRRSKQRLHKLSNPEDWGSSVELSRRGHKMEMRLALQLLVIYMIFNICWLPYAVYVLFIDPNGDGPIVAFHISQLLIFFSSSVNPFLYLYFNRTFRTEVLRIVFKRKLHKPGILVKANHSRLDGEATSEDGRGRYSIHPKPGAINKFV